MLIETPQKPPRKKRNLKKGTYQCVVKRANKDELPIGRKLDEGYRRVLIVNEGLHTVTSGRVPDPAEPIIAA